MDKISDEMILQMFYQEYGGDLAKMGVIRAAYINGFKQCEVLLSIENNFLKNKIKRIEKLLDDIAEYRNKNSRIGHID